MGQKVSSLAGAFSWKNAADSSKNNNAATVTNDSSTSAADAAGTDRNVYGSDAAAGTSQPTVVDCGHEMCRGISRGGSKNTQTLSFKGAKKLNNWVSRFSCSRSKSKNVTKSSTPAENLVPAESIPANQSQIDVEDDESCVGTHYRRTEEDLGAQYRSTEVLNTLYRRSEDLGTPYRRSGELGICSAFDDITSLDDIPPVEAIPCDDDDDEETPPDVLDFNNAFESFSGFQSSLVLPSFDDDMMDLHMGADGFMDEDFEDIAYKERAREIQEGIDPPPGFRPGLHQQLLGLNLSKTALDNLTSLFHRAAAITALTTPQDMDDTHRIHTSIDYIHYLVPDLLQITMCSFYWGKMDRYEAEKLLENKPEGTFLLRDSAQEEYLFSVSFRKYGRSLHARIEQWNHLFSFDSRDPGVFSANTVCGLIEHYKDPTCCMFFEPMLTIPLNRNFTFSLLHTCRAAICSQITYDDVNQLKLPKSLKSYLKEYHYKQRVRVRYLDSEN